ncbi:ABC transporter permease [Tolypothrix sp. FACHB-123]|uniref:ABC transporter permease n=1 Tax=Tolypothrix sp. FACHB-123 TaxID=2692868 RepID=UPI0016848C6F|nr:ABC transporter permease [Tolypothrix sp. FACHB-123]MBD2355064.1 ABC transporter permease [Tolypothrix sp. FACHB-123]
MKQHQQSNSQLTEVIYTPESRLRKPIKLAQQMWRDLLGSRELAWRLLVRDISAQYRQSFFGIAWAFLPPMIMALGFTLANDAKVINIQATDLPYPAYVMFSTALWQTFVEALNSPIQAVMVAKPMLARVNFPREALILAKLGEVFFNFAIKLILIAAFFLWFQIPVNWTVIIAPVALIHLVLLGTFLGILLAPLGILYQDVSRGLTLITSFWLFLTPVVYPVPKQGVFSFLVQLNPVTPLLVTTRELATTGVISDPYRFWVVSAISIFGLIITWVVFRLAMPFVVERVSS